jgi:hypothetical protein
MIDKKMGLHSLLMLERACGRIDKGTGVEHCIIEPTNIGIYLYLLYNLYNHRGI